jgi:hypothetical protein
MADIAYRNEALVRRTDWGAIWAGVFVFMAIWSVFGTLGFAVFASAANPNATQPVLGMGLGIAIWAIVLTIVAMYVAGRETARLAGVVTRADAIAHGMAMFGLSIIGMLVLISLGSYSINTNQSNVTTSTPYLLTVLTGLGWTGFVALVLGWLAAMGGAYSVAGSRAERTTPREIRPAA